MGTIGHYVKSTLMAAVPAIFFYRVRDGVSKPKVNEYSEKIEAIASKITAPWSNVQVSQEPFSGTSGKEGTSKTEEEDHMPLSLGLRRRFVPASKFEDRSNDTIRADAPGPVKLDAAAQAYIDKHGKLQEDLPDGSGWGDHIQLLQIFEQWDQTDYDPNWCKDHGLQVRGMMFVKDVRKQLSQIMQKMARGSLDVRAKERWKESRQDYKNLRKALCAGYAGQLAERMIHHNGYRTLGLKSQLVQVHPSSVLRADEDGMLPNYVLYHELVVTTRPYMRNVCAVEMSWVMPILKKLENININKLSGGSNQVEDRTEEKSSDSPKKSVDVARPPNDAESRIQGARDRFMARKAKR